MSTQPPEVPEPDAPALEALPWDEYAALLSEIDAVEVTEETGH